MRRILICVALIGLAGCATTPIPTGSARYVPRERVLNAALLEQSDGLGQVVVKRDEGFGASACTTRIFANGIPVADIGPGEKVIFYLREGEQMLAAIANGVCAGGLVEARALVNRNHPLVYRVSYGSNGEFSLQPTAF